MELRYKPYLRRFPPPAEAESENATKLIGEIWACDKSELELHVPAGTRGRLGTPSLP